MQPPRVLPPHYFVLSLALIVGFGWLEHGSLLPDPWQYMGAVPVLLGVLIAALGSRLFARVGTNIIPFTESTTLVTSGVFSFSRNPMYTGMVLALSGSAIIMNGLLPWLVVACFIAIIRFYFIRTEEMLMGQTFGADYLAYKSRVRRWL